MNILYLDYDGVLHDGDVRRSRSRGMYLKTPDRFFFEWTPILEQLLAPYPDIKIVLTTTWVRELGFDKAKNELPVSLRNRVIGAPFLHPNMIKAEFDVLSRGMQILGDVGRRQPSHWFALDDDGFGWPAKWRDHLIETDASAGVSDPAIQQRITAWLQRAGHRQGT